MGLILKNKQQTFNQQSIYFQLCILGNFFEESDSKKKSVIRLVFFLWGLGILLSWSYVSITTGKLASIDNSVVTTFLGLSAAKATQRYLETEKTTEEKKE